MAKDKVQKKRQTNQTEKFKEIEQKRKINQKQ
jgi:hypothetical protein